jgi:hypothetical protein
VSEYNDEYARKHMPELSSQVASSTTKRLGLKDAMLKEMRPDEATLTISSSVAM